jgi:hypothetical protein
LRRRKRNLFAVYCATDRNAHALFDSFADSATYSLLVSARRYRYKGRFAGLLGNVRRYRNLYSDSARQRSAH